MIGIYQSIHMSIEQFIYFMVIERVFYTGIVGYDPKCLIMHYLVLIYSF